MCASADPSRRRSWRWQRKAWIMGELVAQRVPELCVRSPRTRRRPRVQQNSRTPLVPVPDRVAHTTKTRHGVEMKRINRTFGSRPAQDVTVSEVNFIAGLAAEGYSRSTIRKTLQTLQMILDHAEVNPNPARDQAQRLPRKDAGGDQPADCREHVEAVLRLLPGEAPARRLHLFLDWVGRPGVGNRARRSSRTTTTQASPCEAAGQPATKTRSGRLWIELHPVLCRMRSRRRFHRCARRAACVSSESATPTPACSRTPALTL